MDQSRGGDYRDRGRYSRDDRYDYSRDRDQYTRDRDDYRLTFNIEFKIICEQCLFTGMVEVEDVLTAEIDTEEVNSESNDICSL